MVWPEKHCSLTGRTGEAAFEEMTPALTYFRLATIIGPACLTAVFGMGTGVSRSV